MERIYRNQIDIIVGPSKFIDQVNTGLLFETMFSDSIAIVGRATHPVMQVSKPRVSDLAGITWVSHSERSVLLSDMETALQQLGIHKPRVAFQSESAGAVLELLKQTDFLTVLPHFTPRADGRDGLAVAQIDLPTKPQLISAITLTDKTEAKLTSDFKTHLREQVGLRYKG